MSPPVITKGSPMFKTKIAYMLCALSLMLSAATFAQAQTADTAAPMVPYINASLFESNVMTAQKPVIIQFGTEWCPFCRKAQPMLSKFAADNASTHDVYRVNTDDEPALAQKYGVRTLPTFVMIRGGQEVARLDGLPDEVELMTFAAK